MRALPLLALALPLFAAEDPREIVRRSLALERANSENWLGYAYRERQFSRQWDGSGKLKSETLRTWDVVTVEGSPYRRLIARNDQPLSPEEQRAEDEKMRRDAAVRRAETKEQRERRIAEWRRRQARQREPMQELAEAFNFSFAGEENVEGAPAWVIDGVPRPGYRPKSSGAAILPKVKARFWVAQADYHWIRIEAETLDTIAYGAFVVRIGKGAHITMEQTRVADGVWLPRRIALEGAARILFVKGIRAQLDMRYSDYRRAASDAAGER